MRNISEYDKHRLFSAIPEKPALVETGSGNPEIAAGYYTSEIYGYIISMAEPEKTLPDAFLKFSVRRAYKGFTLSCEGQFERGITAVFGPSGSGKTTLLDCLSGMLSPDRGEIRVGGSVVYSSTARVDVPSEKRRFGYVFQHGALFPHMSVRGNIEYGYKLTPRPERQFDPDDLADLLAIRGLMERGVENLSGGERQRVALARALASSPRLLLMDEPLASLDAAHRGSILTHLKRISEQLRTPMVFVSHSLSEALALAPRMFALDGGRMVAYGNTPEVMAHPGVARIADYGTLENILRAQVLELDREDGTSRLAIGNVVLVGPPADSRPGEMVSVSIRSGDIILSLGVPPLTSARNAVPAVVREVRETEGRALVYLDMGEMIVAEVTPGSARQLNLKRGRDVHLVIKTNSILTFGLNPG